MNIGQRIRSWRLRFVINPGLQSVKRWCSEMRRRLSGRKHRVSVFLQIDDPYSYLLSCYLPGLLSHYDIELQLYLSEARGEAYQPAPDMLAEYSVADCARLAKELGVPFLDKGRSPPTEYRIALTDAVAAAYGGDDFVNELQQILEIFWRGDSEAAARRCDIAGQVGKSKQVIAESQEIEWDLGHYNSAMLHYGGEWYWGIDRLHYLTSRLDQLGLARSSRPPARLASIRQTMQIALPNAPPAAATPLPSIEFFHSLRSPYSYLLLRRLRDVADAFGVALIVRPVLPMVMRGMKVPIPKLRYIATDTAREAKSLGIPFGRLADPVGAGVERSLAVFQYAKTKQCEYNFLLNAGAAIWSDAVDVGTDSGMRKVTDRTGLSWTDVQAAMQSDDWRAPIEANQEAMMKAGSWGVPTVSMGNLVLWGQDRLWLLVRHIENLCAGDDGVLVLQQRATHRVRV